MNSVAATAPERRAEPPPPGLLPALGPLERTHASTGATTGVPVAQALAPSALFLGSAALLVGPRLPLAGAPVAAGMVVVVAAWVAGLCGRWLGERWWACPRAALVTGVAWQAAVAGCDPASMVVLAALPLGWGLLLRAAQAPTLPRLWVAAMVPAAMLWLGERAVYPYLVLAVPAVVAQARVGGLLAFLSTAYGLAGVALVLSAPYLAWSGGEGPGLTGVTAPWGAAALAAAGLWRGRGNPRLAALPVLAVVGGAGVGGGLAAAAAGLAVLAGGAVAEGPPRRAWVAAALVVGVQVAWAILRRGT